MATYNTIITNAGKALFANAALTNSKVAISHLAVGDGNGSPPMPNATKLVKQTHKVAVNSVERHATRDNWIEVGAIIESSSGGYTVREIGLYAGATLVAIGSFPPTYKPTASEGGAREMSFRIIISVENASVVNVTLDDSLIYATRQWTEDNFVNHNEVINNLTSTDTNKPLSANMGKKLADEKVSKDTNIMVGNGLIGGGNLSASRMVSLGIPSKITATSTNTATTSSHTHEIDKASTTTAGIVQLYDALDSDDATKALTAKQGKALRDKSFANNLINAATKMYLMTIRYLNYRYFMVDFLQQKAGTYTLNIYGEIPDNFAVFIVNDNAGTGQDYLGYYSEQYPYTYPADRLIKKVTDGHYAATFTVDRDFSSLYILDRDTPLMQVVNASSPSAVRTLRIDDISLTGVDYPTAFTPYGLSMADSTKYGLVKLENSLSVLEKNTALDARQGKVIKDSIKHTAYPRHLKGADVYKFTFNNLMIITLKAIVPSNGKITTPEAFAGSWNWYGNTAQGATLTGTKQGNNAITINTNSGIATNDLFQGVSEFTFIGYK